MNIKKYFPLLVVIIGSIPGSFIGLFQPTDNPFVIALFSGLAIFLVSFALIWVCDVAQLDIPQSLAIAVVSLVVVLPEYAVDMYFTWKAGQDPISAYHSYTMANMTGANRLLVGVGWAITVIGYALVYRKPLRLEEDVRTEIAFLFLATFYAYFISYKGSLSLYDTIVFIGMYAWYIRTVSKKNCVDIDMDGVVEALSNFSKKRRWIIICALFLYSGFVIVVNAGAFSESLIVVSKRIGVNEFLFIQWLAPAASEAPELILACLFVLRGQGQLALCSLISAQLNQWTLLVGMIPLVYALSSGAFDPPMLMNDRQSREVLLTASQSLFALSLLLKLRIGFREAVVLLALFTLQAAIPFYSGFIASELSLGGDKLTFQYFFSTIYALLAVVFIVKRRGYFFDLNQGFLFQKNCKNI